LEKIQADSSKGQNKFSTLGSTDIPEYGDSSRRPAVIILLLTTSRAAEKYKVSLKAALHQGNNWQHVAGNMLPIVVLV
jgi:hypothetical protein